MGKKKNKHYDIWDLTPEEQNQQMDEMYAIESGCGSILSLARIDGGINENGLSLGLEKEIAKDLLGYRNTVVNLDGDEVTDYSLEDSVTQMEELIGIKPTVKQGKKKDKNSGINQNVSNSGSFKHVKKSSHVTFKEDMHNEIEVMKNENIRCVKFNIIKDLNRLIIDDGGISPTSYSFDIGLNQDIVAPYDADRVADLCYEMMLYIITLKHPLAIYEYSDFIDKDKWKFVMVDADKFDHKKYIFFRSGGYILAYLIDNKSVDEFYNFMHELRYDVHDILKTFISMSYDVGSLHQAFFVEDDDYIKYFMKSDFNKQEEFHSLFINDTSTKMVDDMESSDIFGVETFILDEVQYNVREQITRLTGSSYFDDDDDFDDEDSEDEEDEFDDNEESEEEEDQIDNSEEDEDYSDLLSADMEEVKGLDNLVIPVIRKN